MMPASQLHRLEVDPQNADHQVGPVDREWLSLFDSLREEGVNADPQVIESDISTQHDENVKKIKELTSIIVEKILALPGISEALRAVLEKQKTFSIENSDFKSNILSEIEHIRKNYQQINDLFKQLKTELDKRHSTLGTDQAEHLEAGDII